MQANEGEKETAEGKDDETLQECTIDEISRKDSGEEVRVRKKLKKKHELNQNPKPRIIVIKKREESIDFKLPHQTNIVKNIIVKDKLGDDVSKSSSVNSDIHSLKMLNQRKPLKITDINAFLNNNNCRLLPVYDVIEKSETTSRKNVAGTNSTFYVQGEGVKTLNNSSSDTPTRSFNVHSEDKAQHEVINDLVTDALKENPSKCTEIKRVIVDNPPTVFSSSIIKSPNKYRHSTGTFKDDNDTYTRSEPSTKPLHCHQINSCEMNNCADIKNRRIDIPCNNKLLMKIDDCFSIRGIEKDTGIYKIQRPLSVSVKSIKTSSSNKNHASGDNIDAHVRDEPSKKPVDSLTTNVYASSTNFNNNYCTFSGDNKLLLRINGIPVVGRIKDNIPSLGTREENTTVQIEDKSLVKQPDHRLVDATEINTYADDSTSVNVLNNDNRPLPKVNSSCCEASFVPNVEVGMDQKQSTVPDQSSTDDFNATKPVHLAGVFGEKTDVVKKDESSTKMFDRYPVEASKVNAHMTHKFPVHEGCFKKNLNNNRGEKLHNKDESEISGGEFCVCAPNEGIHPSAARKSSPKIEDYKMSCRELDSSNSSGATSPSENLPQMSSTNILETSINHKSLSEQEGDTLNQITTTSMLSDHQGDANEVDDAHTNNRNKTILVDQHQFVTSRKRKRTRKRKPKTNETFVKSPDVNKMKSSSISSKIQGMPATHIKFDSDDDGMLVAEPIKVQGESNNIVSRESNYSSMFTQPLNHSTPINLNNEKKIATEVPSNSTFAVQKTNTPPNILKTDVQNPYVTPLKDGTINLINSFDNTVISDDKILKCPLMNTLLPKEGDVIAFKVRITFRSQFQYTYLIFQ